MLTHIFEQRANALRNFAFFAATALFFCGNEKSRRRGKLFVENLAESNFEKFVKSKLFASALVGGDVIVAAFEYVL
jgi:hypothetical protein